MGWRWLLIIDLIAQEYVDSEASQVRCDHPKVGILTTSSCPWTARRTFTLRLLKCEKPVLLFYLAGELSPFLAWLVYSNHPMTRRARVAFNGAGREF